MRASNIQEALASLYLRLNGYFTSGFIVHAPLDYGSTWGEVDVLAVRFPQSREPEREIGPSEYLEVSSDCVDFIIAEVKGGRQALQFNSSLREPERVRKILRWMGAFDEVEIAVLESQLLELMEPREQHEPAEFIQVLGPRATRIRAILFGMNRGQPRHNQPKYIPGSVVMRYVWECMHPDEPRFDCQTAYDYRLWGPYEPIVRYFKRDDCAEPGLVEDLVQFVQQEPDT